MTRLFLELDRLAPLMVWSALGFALAMIAAVVLERAMFGWQQRRSRYIAQRYGPLVQRALDCDAVARRQLLASPARHRIAIAWLLIAPLIEDRDPERIAATRAIDVRTSDRRPLLAEPVVVAACAGAAHARAHPSQGLPRDNPGADRHGRMGFNETTGVPNVTYEFPCL